MIFVSRLSSCRATSLNRHVADPVKFALILLLPRLFLVFTDGLDPPLVTRHSFFMCGSPRNLRNHRDDRLARLLGYRTIELMYRIVGSSPCQPGNLGECDGNTSLSTRFEMIWYDTLRYDSARTRHVVFTGNRLAWDVNHLDSVLTV